jgi:PilZ domain
MKRSRPTLLLAEAISALGDLPADVDARGAEADYQLRILDLRDGALIAEVRGDGQPLIHSTLTMKAADGRRHAATVECVVRSTTRGKLALDVAFVSLHNGRRSSPRAAVHELFLLYGATEVDATVTDVSVGGMRFLCPIAMLPDAEVRGMLNISGRVFPVAALVRHCAERGSEHEVGVEFRFLRAEETDLLGSLADSFDGRRSGEGDPPQAPTEDDIRERLRRWAA